MVRRLAAALLLALLPSLTSHAARELTIYFIDVEGGQATLLITPSGESLLIDTGYAMRGQRGAPPPPPDSSPSLRR